MFVQVVGFFAGVWANMHSEQAAVSVCLSVRCDRCQVSVSTRFEQRLEDGNLRNYGRLVIDLASTVPDGLVVFFVSYSYMDYVIARWHEEGLLAELINHKLIFIETQVATAG